MLPELSNEKRSMLVNYINKQELDYTVIENTINRHHIVAYDEVKFYIYENTLDFVISKYDPAKDIIGNPASDPYTYFTFKSFNEVLQQLEIYDNNIHKTWWKITDNTAEIDSEYNENWTNDIKLEYQIDEYGNIIYLNESYKPEIRSPYNLWAVEANHYDKLDKLYFEIHPISIKEGKESYLLKLLCNSDPIFKEYVNYIVYKKKGLKILLETIFKDMEKFKLAN